MSTSSTTVELSIIVAVYNEEEVLHELHRRLTDALVAIGRSYEILLVDDGSRDRSLDIMTELTALDPKHVRIFSFTRNFGHHIALTAGLDHATGDVVVMMDADLQDQPEELHKLLDKLDEGYDVVWGEREERQFKWYKNITSQLFLWTMNSVVRSQIPMNSSIYRAMRKEVAEDLREMREKARYLPGLVSWLGYRQTSTPVVHGKRFAGETKYSVYRLIKLALSTVTSFSAAPLQLATLIGMGTAVIAFLVLIYIFVRKLLGGYHVLGYASIMFAILFFGALQLIVIGLMGEYISRIYSESQGRPLYLLKELPSSTPKISSRTLTDRAIAREQRFSDLSQSDLAQVERILSNDSQLPSARLVLDQAQLTVVRQTMKAWSKSNPIIFLSRASEQISAFALLQWLDWDTKILGTSSARVLYANTTKRTADNTRIAPMRQVLSGLRNYANLNAIQFIDARIPNEDLFLMRAFEAEGFHTIDMLVTLGVDKKKLGRIVDQSGISRQNGEWQISPALSIRAMRETDVAELAQLSYDAFGEHDMIQDRFFLEPSINPNNAQELFRQWFLNLSKKHREGDGFILVAELGDTVAGYTALERVSIGGETWWKDSLNAVAPIARGQGVYKALILAALSYTRDTNADGILTKTQSSTYRVINTWLHLGCDLYESATTLHYISNTTLEA